MVQANFQSVFIGIETPRESSLTETRKHQNVHGDSLLEKLTRIRARGLVVSGGFIVGFDNDDERIFDEQFEFIQASGIANLSISLLTPLPTTPLYDRLLAEGRLDLSDPELIYIPRQMTREQLKSGFRVLLNRVFDVDAYFDRVFTGSNIDQREERINAKAPLTQRLLFTSAWIARAILLVFVIAKQRLLLRHVHAVSRVLRKNAALGKDGFGFGEMVGHLIAYWHFSSVTRQISGTMFGNVPQVSAARLVQDKVPFRSVAGVDRNII